jgi:hypothetical protein
MQSIYLSRSVFGCTRISLITAALFVGTLALGGVAGAQEPTSSQRPVPESPAMAEHNAAPTSLHEAAFYVRRGLQEWWLACDGRPGATSRGRSRALAWKTPRQVASRKAE